MCHYQSSSDFGCLLGRLELPLVPNYWNLSRSGIFKQRLRVPLNCEERLGYFCEANTYNRVQSSYTPTNADALGEWTMQTLQSIAGPLHEQPAYDKTTTPDMGIYKMSDDKVKLGLLSDWGAGTYESQVVADQLQHENPDYGEM